MNSYSPTQTPIARAADYTAPTLGLDMRERTEQADRNAKAVSMMREHLIVTDKLTTARAAAKTAEDAFDKWRAEVASTRQSVAELERALADLNTGLGLVAPPPLAPVVHTKAPIGPTLSAARAELAAAPADALAQAYGYPTARAHAKARLLGSVGETVRAALEANGAALTAAVDLVLAGRETEALAAANAVGTKSAKAKQ